MCGTHNTIYIANTKIAIICNGIVFSYECQITFFLGKKIFIVSKQKNRQKIQKIDIYNIHKLYTKQKNKKKTTHNIKHKT